MNDKKCFQILQPEKMDNFVLFYGQQVFPPKDIRESCCPPPRAPFIVFLRYIYHILCGRSSSFLVRNIRNDPFWAGKHTQGPRPGLSVRYVPSGYGKTNIYRRIRDSGMWVLCRYVLILMCLDCPRMS